MLKTEKNSLDTVFQKYDNQLSVDEVSKKYKLQLQGGIDGKDNVPKFDSEVSSPTELTVISHFNEISIKAFNLYSTNIGRLIEERKNIKNELNIDENISTINRIQNQYKPKVFHCLEENKSKIASKAEEYGDLVRNFKNFQLQNHLTSRSPSYPESNVSHLKWIIVGAVVELFLAIFFYMEVSSTPLSGIAFGLLVVVINVLLSFISGDRLRFINHKDIKQKIPYTTLSIIMFLCFMSAILIAAHLRQAIVKVVSNPDFSNSTLDLMGEAGRQAWITAHADPLSFGSDATAVLFFLASFGFGVLVCWKGYTHDDEYPGYGAIDRQKKLKELDLQTTKEYLFNEIQAILNNNKSELKKVFQDSVSRCEQIIENITDHRLQLSHASRKFTHYESNLNSALSIYRAANVFVRTTDAPNYFSHVQSLENDHFSELELVTEVDEGVEMSLKEHIRQLTDTYNSESTSLSTFEGATLDEVHKTVSLLVSKSTLGTR